MKRTVLILTLAALLLLTAACGKVKNDDAAQTTAATTTARFSYAPDVTDPYETPIIPAQPVPATGRATGEATTKAAPSGSGKTGLSASDAETPILNGETKKADPAAATTKAAGATAATKAADPKATTGAPGKQEPGTTASGAVTQPSGEKATTPAGLVTEEFETPIL